MAAVYWLAAYVLLFLVANRVGEYAIMQLWVKTYRCLGYVVTVQHKIGYSVLNARKQGESEITMRYGWFRW